MRYEGSIYRPPSEANAYILQATIGCSWNVCTYCDMYRDKSFRVREISQTLADIEAAGERFGSQVDKVFVVLSPGPVLDVGAVLVAVVLAEEIKHILADVGAVQGVEVQFHGVHQLPEPRRGEAAGFQAVQRQRLGRLGSRLIGKVVDAEAQVEKALIQELEAAFRGAGWNVIKVIWGDDWDPLLAQDEQGLLVKRMEECVDGDYQAYKAKGGAYTRKHFFGKYPELADMVATGLCRYLAEDGLTLMDEPEKIPIAGKVVWVTPRGAQGNRTAGIGVQFSEQDNGAARNKIETYLAGALQADRPTHTM